MDRTPNTIPTSEYSRVPTSLGMGPPLVKPCIPARHPLGRARAPWALFRAWSPWSRAPCPIAASPWWPVRDGACGSRTTGSRSTIAPQETGNPHPKWALGAHKSVAKPPKTAHGAVPSPLKRGLSFKQHWELEIPQCNRPLGRALAQAGAFSPPYFHPHTMVRSCTPEQPWGPEQLLPWAPTLPKALVHGGRTCTPPCRNLPSRL